MKIPIYDIQLVDDIDEMLCISLVEQPAVEKPFIAFDKQKEIWKSLDFIGYPNYEVSNRGRVKSLNYKRTGEERLLKPFKNNKGYSVIPLYKNNKQKHFLVHRLVAQTFLKNDNNYPCVNHKDENPSNNHVDNLEFCTYKYNNNYGTKLQRQSEKIKGKFIGKNNPFYGKHHTKETKRKLSKPIIQLDLQENFIREWDSATTASKELNLSQGHISSCCKGERNKCGGFIWRYK